MKQDRLTVHRAVRLLPSAFVVIIVAFVLGNLLVLLSARRIQAANRRISQNAMVSIVDVSRIVHDIDLQRVFIGDHIFETTIEQMEPLERNIAKAQADLARAAQDYDRVTTFPGELQVWQNVREQMGDLRRPIEYVLQLSRSNRDVEARKAFAPIDKRFDDINQKAEVLIKLNRDEAANAIDEIQTLQHRSLLFLGVITAVGTVLGLAVTVSVTRIIKRRDQELAEAALLLEARNRELDAFSGRVAHDLRGPLTTINLAALRLSEAVPQEDGGLAVLRRGIERMDALIRDLLALSRVEGGMSEAVADISGIAVSLEEELKTSVNNVNGVLRAQLEPAVVRCSDVLLRQALWNICDNAVKYRRSNVRFELDIRGEKVRDFYELRISDNGSGMSPEDAGRVFEPFFRAGEARSKPGTGLGLSIVKRVIEASGGAVSVHSELGKGTIFVIGLPLAPNGARSQPTERHRRAV